MKTKAIKPAVALLLFIATMALNSCKKENADVDFVTANNQALADEAAQTGSVSYKTDDANSLLAGCAVVTRDTVSFPRVTTIDFGTGCTGADGKVRKGIITVTHDGPYREAGTTITITFTNYFVNDNQVLGTKTVHNDGLNNNGNLSFTVTVSGQIIRANGQGTITWTSQRTREWIAGSATSTRDDDRYSITGSASGTASNGDAFRATIVNALVRNLELGCRRHFVAGSVLIERTGKPDRTIDFGNGACDDEATVTINGVSHTITLH